MRQDKQLKLGVDACDSVFLVNTDCMQAAKQLCWKDQGKITAYYEVGQSILCNFIVKVWLDPIVRTKYWDCQVKDCIDVWISQSAPGMRVVVCSLPTPGWWTPESITSFCCIHCHWPDVIHGHFISWPQQQRWRCVICPFMGLAVQVMHAAGSVVTTISVKNDHTSWWVHWQSVNCTVNERQCSVCKHMSRTASPFKHTDTGKLIFIRPNNKASELINSINYKTVSFLNSMHSLQCHWSHQVK